MTTSNDPGTAPSTSRGSSGLPSPAALVGVWARAILTLWDLAFEWWKVLPESGYAEDPRLGVWSTTVYFPRRGHDITVEPLPLRTTLGDIVPDAEVDLAPKVVEHGPDGEGKELAVTVRRVPRGRYRFVLTIRDRDDQSFAREYGLSFGVPGADA